MRKLVVLSLLVGSPLTASAADVAEAACAYAAGRFGAAAVKLEQAAAETRGRGDALPAIASYLLGRTFAELGLDGLALRRLADAEREGDGEWRTLARREIARIQLPAGDSAKGIDVGEPNGVGDPDLRYATGLEAAKLGDWARAAEALGSIPGSSELYPYARYVRAQTEAAAGDLEAALSDLGEVLRSAPAARAPRSAIELAARDLLEPAGGESGAFRPIFHATERPVSLADRAALLRGKILYVEGRPDEARTWFAAVGDEGRTGVEAMSGLALTGPDRGASLGFDSSAPVTVEAATLMGARAIAAERRGDFAAAFAVRRQLAGRIARRLEELRRLGESTPWQRRLTADLGEFWLRLRRSRAEQRWRDESTVAGTSCSFGPGPSPLDTAFEPHDEVFRAMWNGAANRALHRLSALIAETAELETDLDAPPERRLFWEVWRADDDERLGTALLVLRETNLELQAADWPSDRSRSDAAFGDERREAVVAAVEDLARIYADGDADPPDGAAAPDDSRRALARSLLELPTEAAIATLGEIVERSQARAAPQSGRAERGPLERMHRALLALEDRLGARARLAIESARRDEIALFERIAADNQGSLSRLYPRLVVAEPRPDREPAR